MYRDDEIDDDFLYKYMKKYDDEMIENLPNDDELNHTFSDGFNKKMDRLIKDENKNTFFINFKYYSKTAIVYVVLVTSITLGVTITAYAYRVRIFEIISTVFKEFTSISISSENNPDNYKLIPIESSYIPDGYTIIEKICDDYEQRIIYSNDVGNEILYTQTLLTNGNFIIDTEDAQLENLDIDGINVNIVQKNGNTMIYWNDENYFYNFSGYAEKSILLDMAKNILQKN